MARLRYNGLTTTLGAPLASGDTTITFAAALTSAAGAVPTLSAGDTIALSLLDGTGAVTEIVSLTAYTSGATTGTITRAQESTTVAAHASGATVVHSPTAADFVTGGSSSFVGCAAERTTAQSIPHASWTVIQLNATDVYDTDSIHSPTTNNTRFTIPIGKAGVWRFTASDEFAANGSGVRVCGWKKNGTDLADRRGSLYRGASPLFTTVMTATVDLLLAEGDYIEHRVYQESGGGALNLSGAYITCQFLG